ncbi:unnamed protein product [Didymodactylos carnosus]|uniref:UBC core domain-containing protein n=1 Tax=Didymodactylos carnosus TaxID=1234261 RepID=A0A813VIR0_9BILA|nr:unnamed protein product [Didymodactylos carnosus]CAF0917383.1 unnamed protein product [Didymodactylos carnosus]CAF3631354.1 unnamed protein product [Didymodactylos carnosus]CAF3695433.1 unnamed protein product [Didymodactylos carnosus]
MKFSTEYPYQPPLMKFLTSMWHPNIYIDGNICISILHAPGDDERSGEKACERWSAAQNVRTILLSIISMLSEPNTFSPANLDASVEYRKWKEEGNPAYVDHVKQLVELSQQTAEEEKVKIPTTIEEYTNQLNNIKQSSMTSSIDDFIEEINDEDDDSQVNCEIYEEKTKSPTSNLITVFKSTNSETTKLNNHK